MKTLVFPKKKIPGIYVKTRRCTINLRSISRNLGKCSGCSGNSNEPGRGISVPRVRGNLREWKMSREWIEYIPWKFRWYGGCLAGKISPPIDSAPFIEYLKMVVLFVTKEDTIRRTSIVSYTSLNVSNSPSTWSPRSWSFFFFLNK